MRLAEAQLLGDARDAERLAGKAGTENVMQWNGGVRHGINVPVRTLAEVGLVAKLLQQSGE